MDHDRSIMQTTHLEALFRLADGAVLMLLRDGSTLRQEPNGTVCECDRYGWPKEVAACDWHPISTCPARRWISSLGSGILSRPTAAIFSCH